MSPMTQPTNTTMCISAADLNWHSDSAGPVAVFDGASPTLAMLGKSDGPVTGGKLTFGGVEFTFRKPTGSAGSAYLMLHVTL